MLHYLRIAATALSLTVCLLLIALWVRSYWYLDQFQRVDESKDVFAIGSEYGVLFFNRMDKLPIQPTNGWTLSPAIRSTVEKQWFSWHTHDGFLYIAVPFWAVVPPLALLGILVAPRDIRWSRRFSLRTLLIATTLVAVGMGVIVAAM